MSYQQEREEFLVKIASEGLPVYQARKVLAMANRLQVIAELSCSSEAADRDRVKCPADPSRKFGKGECLCDQYHGEGQHDDVPRIDVQEARLKRRMVALLDEHNARYPLHRVVEERSAYRPAGILYVGKTAEDCQNWLAQEVHTEGSQIHSGHCKIEPTGIKANFQGDPRGAVVKLAVPSGKYDDMSREGLCVPSKGLPVSFWERNR